jgi:hypothetical protein
MRVIDANQPPQWNPEHVKRINARLVIELEPGDPVCGWLGREGGTPTHFEGMLGFLSLFERLRREQDHGGDAEPGGDCGTPRPPRVQKSQ